MDIEIIRKEFKTHYMKYDCTEPAIIRKYYHSIRVMDLSMLIAKYNNFNDNDALIAAIAGLLHDYSRFEQWTNYKTYSDIRSIDHGDLAVKRLFDENEIANYYLNEENYDEIYDAIKYHNKLEIPSDLTSHNTLLCKVIRDADKLDIFYLLGINKELIKEDFQDISGEVVESFYKNKPINSKTVKSKSDSILYFLAMMFDINFKYSYEHIKNNNLLWKIFDNIDEKNKYIKYFAYMEEYINERIDENVK